MSLSRPVHDQIVDLRGEPALDVGQGGGEPLGAGVEQLTDLGQRHTRPGQRADLDQPEQVSRHVPGVTLVNHPS